ncbi:SOS responce UmuC protein [Streptococcus pneumoniae]|nr:SOS responce UmuC protein [Streptococcus pneumoniae]
MSWFDYSLEPQSDIAFIDMKNQQGNTMESYF